MPAPSWARPRSGRPQATGAEAAFNATSDAPAARFRQVGLPPDDATRRATLLMFAAEGAVIVARARPSVEPLTFIAEQLSGTRSGAPPAMSKNWG